jgi:hypothetical protein
VRGTSGPRWRTWCGPGNLKTRERRNRPGVSASSLPRASTTPLSGVAFELSDRVLRTKNLGRVYDHPSEAVDLSAVIAGPARPVPARSTRKFSLGRGPLVALAEPGQGAGAGQAGGVMAGLGPSTGTPQRWPRRRLTSAIVTVSASKSVGCPREGESTTCPKRSGHRPALAMDVRACGCRHGGAPSRSADSTPPLAQGQPVANP